jgi:hypothetical protein
MLGRQRLALHCSNRGKSVGIATDQAGRIFALT